ncbi:MAG: aspartate--tRNA(Asn) ligase [Candidatus Aenigmarchaeota archaeon]|nr:aspartate--tRNA(Asn) ligase [Candidatus Aenigmarchaeota archaeon]
MERTYTSELKSGKKVLVMGWARNIRELGGLIFIQLADREGSVQVTLKKGETDDKILKIVKEMNREDCFSVEGSVVKSKQAPGGVELKPTAIEIISKADTPLPIEFDGKIKTGLDKRLDYRFLDLRNPRNMAIFKIRSQMFKATTDFFDSQGFMNINTPKLTVAGVESGAELFPVMYFNKEAFLSQSPQIYKQMMVMGGFEKVYEIAPVFRAEKSHTTRHLTEFTGIDFEMGFIKDVHDVMDVNENLMKHIIGHILKKCDEELKIFDIKLKVPKKIPRITMKEAKEMLAKKGKKLGEKDDLDAEGEKLLGKLMNEKTGEDFVFVYNYPWEKRPFYHMKPEDDPSITSSFDLIWNGVEISTGAQREHRYDILKKQAKEKGVNLDEMKDYGNIFLFGSMPHGGTGFGLDRFVECLLKLENIREAILLPRDPERLTP